MQAQPEATANIPHVPHISRLLPEPPRGRHWQDAARRAAALLRRVHEGERRRRHSDNTGLSVSGRTPVGQQGW